jgi:hypothetical protein
VDEYAVLLAKILKQVPTTEMQTVSWESAYPSGPWLPPPLSTPPQTSNSKTGPARMSQEALMGGPNLSQQEFISQGTRDEQNSNYAQQKKGVLLLSKPKKL